MWLADWSTGYSREALASLATAALFRGCEYRAAELACGWSKGWYVALSHEPHSQPCIGACIEAELAWGCHAVTSA